MGDENRQDGLDRLMRGDHPPPPPFPGNLDRSLSGTSETSLDILCKQEPLLECPATFSGLSSEDSGLTPSNCPTDPTPHLTDQPGRYNFCLDFSPDVCQEACRIVSKEPATFSQTLRKLFIKMDTPCQLKFSVDRPLTGASIRVVPVFEQSCHIQEPVVRCIHHQSVHKIPSPAHLVRCEDPAAVYDLDHMSRRYSTVVPLPDCHLSVAHSFRFACLSTCVGGINRRGLKLICSLERDRKVLGRRVIGLKVSTCPGRERNTEEGGRLAKTGGRKRKTASPSQARSNRSAYRLPPISTPTVPCGPSAAAAGGPSDTAPSAHQSHRATRFQVVIQVQNEQSYQYALQCKNFIENSDIIMSSNWA